MRLLFPQLPDRWHPAAWALLAFVVLSGTTLGLFAATDRGIRDGYEGRTRVLTEQVGERIRSCVTTRVEMISAMSHEWNLGALRSDEAFAARAGAMIAAFPGYLAINRVDGEGVIRHVFPRSANERALEQSVVDQPFARDAFLAAMKAGTPQLTAPGQLFQGGTGVAAYVPYLAEGPGALNGVFRTDTLIPACLGERTPADCGYTLREGDGIIFQHVIPEPEPDFAAEVSFAVLNRTWTLTVTPTAQSVAMVRRPARWLRAGGLALSLALSLLLLMLLSVRQASLEQSLHSEEERRRLVALVDAAHDFVGFSIPNGPIEYLNPAARRVVGLEGGLGEFTPSDFVHPEDRETFAAHIQRANETGWSRSEVRLVNRKTSEVTPMEFQSFMVGEGENRRRATVGRDLREHRRLEVQLHQAQKMEALGRLAGGVAHDFNNLLTIIQSGAALLQREPDGPERQDLISEIEDAGQRAAALTRQLLALGRGRTSEFAELDVGEHVAKLRTLFERLVRSDIVLEVRTPPVAARVNGSATQLEQIVVNLVMNGMDAMPRGGALLVRVEVEGGEVLLSVEDSGSGMSPEVAARIFEPFYTTKEAGRGTGLGLATVFGHVQGMGGRIDVESTPGKGSRFIVRLPQLLEHRGDAPSKTEPENVSTLPRSVLLVENDPGVRSAVGRLLRHEGIEVFEADSGQTALSMLSDRGRPAPELILSDVVMPYRGGVDVLLWTRENLPNVPVVLMSGYPGEALNALDLTALKVPFLTKPVTRDALCAALRKAMRQQSGQPA